MAPGHWGFRVVSPLVESLDWGLVDCRHRRHYLDCRESPLGKGNRNLRFPDRFHLEGGVPFTLSSSSMISSEMSESEGGSSGTKEVSPEG